MKNLRIMLCCGAGMSSGFLASNARKVAKKGKKAVTIEARSYSEISGYLSMIDVLMIGPHYAKELAHYQKMAEPFNVPVVVIPQDIYGSLNGAGLLELAEKVEKEFTL